MNGLIILVSILFVAYIVLKIFRSKKAKYVLAPIISLLYGAILFFIGMGIGTVLYYVLAVIPVIAGVVFIIKQNYIKKN